MTNGGSKSNVDQFGGYGNYYGRYGRSVYMGESRISFLLLAIVSAAIFCGSVYFSWQARLTSEWLPTRGEVTTDTQKSFAYKYRINGNLYTSGAISALSFIDQIFNVRCLDNFEDYRGKQVVTVHYDPHNPAKSLLTPGLPLILILAMVGSGAFTVFGFLAFISGCTTPVYSESPADLLTDLID